MRRTETFKLNEEMAKQLPEGKTFGRDGGKTFRLKEMSAVDLERWHARAIAFFKKNLAKGALPALEQAQADKTEQEFSATLAFSSYLDKAAENTAEFIDLLNEHLYCYEVFNPTCEAFEQLTKENIADKIDEVATLQFLRNKAVEFNCLDFTNGGR